MDMTSTADSVRWYDTPRVGGSPNTGGAPSGGNHQSGGVDSSDMGAFYSLENGGHRRYSSYGYSHGEFFFFLIYLFF